MNRIGGAVRQTIKVRAFVEALMPDLELSARTRRVRLEALVFSDELKADANLLRRLLTVLIGEALRRAPSETIVTLVVSPCGRHTEFRVADQRAGTAG